MPVPQRIDDRLLDNLSRAAQVSPRRRKNHNLHKDYEDPCQRLLNAVEPDSYVRPHRHLDPPRPECFLLLRGRLAVLLFAADGGIEEVVLLAADGPCRGVDIPAGVWHSLVSLEAGSVFFETKPGPYRPLADKDFAPWAPAEGSAQAADYLKILEAAVFEGSARA